MGSGITRKGLYPVMLCFPRERREQELRLPKVLPALRG